MSMMARTEIIHIDRRDEGNGLTSGYRTPFTQAGDKKHTNIMDILDGDYQSVS